MTEPTARPYDYLIAESFKDKKKVKASDLRDLVASVRDGTLTGSLYADVPAWYLDAAAGDDANSGTIQSAPLRTHRALEDRVRAAGPTAGYTVTVLSDHTGEDILIDPLLRCPDPDAAGFVAYTAAPVALYSGTVTSRVLWNATTEVRGTVTDSALAVSWTAQAGGLVGYYAVVTAGPRTGTRFFIESDAGSKTANVSMPLAGEFDGTPSTLEVGDAFTVYRFVKFGNLVTLLGRGTAGAQVAFQYLELGKAGPHSVLVQGGAFFDSCIIHGLDAQGPVTPQLYNCRTVGGCRSQLGSQVYCTAGVSDGVEVRAGSVLVLDGHHVVGERIDVEDDGLLRIAGGAIGWAAVHNALALTYTGRGQFDLDGKLWGAPYDPPWQDIGPTTILASLLTAKVNAGWRKFRLHGTCTLESNIAVDHTWSNLVLRGDGSGVGGTEIVAGTAPLAALADARTNALMAFAAVERTDIWSTTLTTTLSVGGAAWYAEGTRKFGVASLGSAAADQWFVIGGTDCTGRSPGGQSGSGYQTRELLRIESTTSSPDPRVTLKWATKQHHSRDVSGVGGTTPYIRAITAPPANIRISGIKFTATTHAVALRFDDCLDCAVDDVAFEGFSRSPIEVKGGINVGGVDVHVKSSNGGILADTAIDSSWDGFTTAQDGLLTHANGVHRAAVWVENACHAFRMTRVHIQHRVHGISVRGVAGACHIEAPVVEDIHGYAMTLPADTAGVIGYAICSGGGEGPKDEHSFGLTVANFRVRNVFASSAAAGLADINDIYVGAVCQHDTVDANFSGVIEVGLGGSPTIDGSATYATAGFISQDAGGVVSVRVIGAQYAFVHRSAVQPVYYTGCEHLVSPNSGANATVSFLMYGGLGLNVHNFYGQGYLWFTSGYGGQVDPYGAKYTGFLSMDGEIVDGPLLVCKVTGEVADNGEAWALDSSTANNGELQLKLPAADTDHIRVPRGRQNLSGWPNGGFALCSPPGAGRILTNDAANVGDYFDFQIGATLWVRGASSGTVKGARTRVRALEKKAAGAGLLRVEAVQ